MSAAIVDMGGESFKDNVEHDRDGNIISVCLKSHWLMGGDRYAIGDVVECHDPHNLQSRKYSEKGEIIVLSEKHFHYYATVDLDEGDIVETPLSDVRHAVRRAG